MRPHLSAAVVLGPSCVVASSEAALSFSYHLVEIGESAPRLSVLSAVRNAVSISLKVVFVVFYHESLKAAITCGMYALMRRKSIMRF